MPLIPPPTINTSPQFLSVEVLFTGSCPLDHFANDLRDVLDLDLVLHLENQAAVLEHGDAVGARGDQQVGPDGSGLL